MTIEPWRATCIQTVSKLAVKAPHRDGAWTIIDENIAHALALIEAATQSADPPKLVVLPEFAFQGPPHGLPVANWIEKACCAIPGRITAPLQDLAHRAHIYVAAHQFESVSQWPGRYFNTSFLIDPTGAVILRYRRVNTAAFPSPHDFMDAYLARHSMAEIFPVVDTELGRLAMVPCGEINVPEVARVLMMQGAEVILHPTNSPRRPTQEAAKIVRAAENMVYIVSANVAEGIGFSWDGSVQGGRSHIIDYLGRTLAYEDGAGENHVGLGADRCRSATRSAQAGYGNGQPPAARALGNVPAVLRSGVVLSAQQLPPHADVGRSLRGGGAGHVLAQHGKRRRHR